MGRAANIDSRSGDGNLAGFCVHSLVSYILSSRFSASKNATGSMGGSAEQMHGTHSIYQNSFQSFFLSSSIIML